MIDKNKLFNENIPLAKYFCKQIYFRYKHHFEPDDFLQVCYIGLWKACKSFNGDKKQWSSFAFNCMKNEIHNEDSLLFGGKKREGMDKNISIDSTYENGEPVYNPSIEYDFEKLGTAAEIRSKLKLLSEKQRVAIHQYYWEGYSLREIAEKQGKTHEAIRQLLNYGKKRLELSLKQYV